MKLYYTRSVCSLAVRIVMHELGLSCEYESVDLATKKTETGADYIKINPKGSVPGLELNNHEFLTENAVILQYLADTHHAATLLPPIGEMKRYRVLEWLNFVTTDLHRYAAPLFSNQIPEDIKEIVFLSKLRSKLTFVNDALENNPYLMGDTLTLGDTYLFVVLIWLARVKFSTAAWPNLARYFNDMKQVKSVHQSLDEEDLLNIDLQ